MSYNKQNLPRYVETAGKITVLTALTGVLLFAFVFILNIGKTELQRAEAQGTGAATTTLTVLNTPPQWVGGQEGREEFGSGTTTPTNSGSLVSWIGTATDSNGAPYFLIVCGNSATPTPQMSTTTLGTAPPICSSGGTRWAVSTSTLSGVEARAATTTLESGAFGESNVWYAWVCDDDPVNPRCSTTYSQGLSASNSSPFNVNRRPVFTTFYNDGPKAPGTVVTFLSTSTDPDIVDVEDNIYLIVCSANTYSTTTNQCGPGDFLASTTIGVLANATTSYTLPAVVQDTNYNAYGYLYDQHGHSATGGAQGSNVQFAVSNVAPTVAGGTISLNGGTDITLSAPGAETTGFTLEFTVADANSCDAVGGGTADEVTGYVASVFRSGVGTSTCNGTGGSYNPNNCYPSGVGAAVWNIACTASSTSCTGATDDTVNYSCTFPLWFIADPTNGVITDTPFYNQHWAAGISGIDNNSATGSMSTSTSVVELQSLVAIDLVDKLIAYTQMEPGNNMPNLSASTTMRVLGNTGLNQLLGGDSMCGTYSPTSACPVSATSTIPQSEQRYGTSSVVYASGVALAATTSPATLLIQIPKPISTSTPTTGKTYWGIAVPSAISLAGAYTGQNTFTGAVSSPVSW
jgi:hypothetical protein